MANSADDLNCTVTDGVINMDSDLIGPGVLAAFFITAAITILTVIFGYLSNSLDEDLMDDRDQKMISLCIGMSSKLSALFWAAARPPFSHNQYRRSLIHPESLNPRREAITKFILALSDQQLVTGLAILVAGISNQKHLCHYEFSMVLCLAWFSSTAHLTTLDALRTYLRNHPVIRDIRVLGIISALMMLIYTFTVTFVAAGGDNTVPVQCLLNSHPRFLLSYLDAIDWALPLLLILFGSISRIYDLYFDHRVIPVVWAYFGWQRIRLRTPKASYDQILLETREELYIRELRSIRNSKWTLDKFCRSFIQPLTSRRSFHSSLSLLAFSLTYGIAQLVTFRWSYPPNFAPDANNMGFGQILTLLLLILPFLTALEIYFEYVDKVSLEIESSNRTPNLQIRGYLASGALGASHRQIRGGGETTATIQMDKDRIKLFSDEEVQRVFTEHREYIEGIFPRKCRLITNLEHQIAAGSSHIGFQHQNLLYSKQCLLLDVVEIQQLVKSDDGGALVLFILISELLFNIFLGVYLNGIINLADYRSFGSMMFAVSHGRRWVIQTLRTIEQLISLISVIKKG